MRFGFALAMALGVVLGCERSPSAPSVNEGLPQSADGRRTSIPGKAMDRAEDLKKEVDAYNKAIEDTIAQGTSDAPPKRAPSKGTPAQDGPATKPSETP